MKANWEDDYEIPDQIDFSKLKRVPNPFSQKFEELNLVSLDEDVKKAFPDSEAVNKALRALMEKSAQGTEELAKAS